MLFVLKQEHQVDDRGRTFWTAERDESLCTAVALQSLNDVADWECIRRAVGASSVGAAQHRWLRLVCRYVGDLGLLEGRTISHDHFSALRDVENRAQACCGF